jgi:hypothetical protein
MRADLLLFSNAHGTLAEMDNTLEHNTTLFSDHRIRVMKIKKFETLKYLEVK